MPKLHYVKIRRVLQKILTTILCATLLFNPVMALSSEQLDFFAQNNILFYDPSGNSCAASSNGVYKGAQYSLTNEEITATVQIAKCEQEVAGMAGLKSEYSHMANLFEYANKPGENPAQYLMEYGKDTNWYSCARLWQKNDGGVRSKTVSEDDRRAVEDVIMNGNRTLPPQIVEHGSLSELYMSNDGINFLKADEVDASVYKSGITIMASDSSGNGQWIFYRWANPDGTTQQNRGDPFGYYESNPPNGSYSEVVTTNANKNYIGDQVFSDSELQEIRRNQSVYEQVAEKYDFPWQILAVIHSQEHSLSRTNPANGQGIYQLYSYTAGGTNGNRFEPTTGPVSDEEFARQTDLAAQVIINKASGRNLNSDDNVKRLFFNYNGASQVYINKAISMGFTAEQATNGEGSPYVMNRYDAKRDPTNPSTMDSKWKGRFVRDGKYNEEATSTGFGTYVKYLALGGGSGDNCSNVSSNRTINQVAIELTKNNMVDHYVEFNDNITDEYKKALQEFEKYFHRNERDDGKDCALFVNTVVFASGYDLEMGRRSTASLIEYFPNHPEKWTEIENIGNTSNLQPGDIFVVRTGGKGHTLIYVVLDDGREGFAEASKDKRPGMLHTNAISFKLWGAKYRIFRATGEP